MKRGLIILAVAAFAAGVGANITWRAVERSAAANITWDITQDSATGAWGS